MGKLFAIIACSLILGGCLLGPDYKKPLPPVVKSYTEKKLMQQTHAIPGIGSVGQRQFFMIGKDVPGQWWTLFHSQALNNLITRGIANSPNLMAAKAALTQARENLNAQIAGSIFPSINAQFGIQREGFTGSTFGTTAFGGVFSVYNTNVNVSYNLDMFGAARRQIEALYSQVDYQQFQVEAAYLTLSTNIVTTAVAVASLQEQIRATRELIVDEQNALSIMQKQLHLGGISGTDVLTQTTNVAQLRATLPPLEKSLAQTRHALAVLVGSVPSEAHIPVLNLNRFILPSKLPLSLPSRLVQQRPDVRAQMALLHAANAQVGVATANLFPQFPITGADGWSSNSFNSLFLNINSVWNIAGQMTQPIFDAGMRLAKRRAAIANFQQVLAQYKQTLLQAFQNVADTLRAIDVDAKALQAQHYAFVAADQTLKVTKQQYHLGGVSYLNLLNAERAYEQAKINYIQAKAQRFIDTATLFQALGGGWWNRPNSVALIASSQPSPAHCQKKAVTQEKK